ncbi:thiamine diphosphokinase [Chelativorans sp. ZYF759]|jgi:thiamine pyrophosphokinase|uniref:thiamine diphosphokinase n=1 Tax=Chelativorans sp. ZYF759 TaxID=2692213 RepID=UPI00145D9290|nr:thiamine diphosphokinase [Chelativorans sp. ZYF759]NMG40704.1 thiamine diphosphokinase [Chelativorans sp. ZYF759]
MTRFAILLGGDVVPTPRLSRQLEGRRSIAADSGMRHAGPLGLVPELWTGDFDSVGPDMAAGFPDIAREVFPAEKDVTDGEIAVEAAIKRGATSLLLAGAFGGPRPDHAFLHMAMALNLAERGLDILLSSGDQEGVPLLPGDSAFDYPPGTLFSVVGFTPLSSLTLIGAKWPLDRHEVAFGSSLTLSNAVADRLSARLGAGRAMLIAHTGPEAR